LALRSGPAVGLGVPVVCFPFPARSRGRYVRGLVEVIRALEEGSTPAGGGFCSGRRSHGLKGSAPGSPR